MTKIQKTEGDLEALKSDLAQALNLETGSKKSEVTINSTTGHIIVKVTLHSPFSFVDWPEPPINIHLVIYRAGAKMRFKSFSWNGTFRVENKMKSRESIVLPFTVRTSAHKEVKCQSSRNPSNSSPPPHRPLLVSCSISSGVSSTCIVAEFLVLLLCINVFFMRDLTCTFMGCISYFSRLFSLLLF